MKYSCKFSCGSKLNEKGTLIDFGNSKGEATAIIIDDDGGLYETTLINVSDVKPIRCHKYLKDMILEEIIEKVYRFDEYTSQAILLEITRRKKMVDAIIESCKNQTMGNVE